MNNKQCAEVIRGLIKKTYFGESDLVALDKFVRNADSGVWQLEIDRLTALIADYNESLYQAVRLRDKYKTALERVLKSTSGSFREIAREALNE